MTLLDRLSEQEQAVVKVMLRIPFGRCATYGLVAKAAEAWFSTRYGALNVGKLRARLYGHSPGRKHTAAVVPLHRLGSKGDLEAENDSDETRIEVMVRRQLEGSWLRKDAWLGPEWLDSGQP